MTPAEVLRAVCDAWEAGDPAAASGLFAPDGVYEDPLYPRRSPAPMRSGPAWWRAWVRSRTAASTLDPVIEEGDRVLAVGFFASRLRESGERFDFPFAILVEMRDGKIARLAEYFDTRPLVP